ncbi:filamentous hemagglutinin N-terminal domain-containing protein [Nostoc sp. FACHB-87]|uniref:two-partner secretion domain-containing protein n=1 Tax=Nostocaceae TaxID=1162 RepID=UPI0016887062|nr:MULTISPECIES: filamentous hemagglutinin N-terminal domain-containing protein [Nostocaceae]MBD2452709.1 filamentous hemagglutinin N-terminal domain-containing protein [Nostoc sp. FACHB-87]MBD2473640.1 filamentous hemagglutinin N-terminal domain-containing protein [Anabaena sp. FACHB-83]
MNNLEFQLKSLGIAIGSFIAFCANSATAQIIPDRTLPNNSQVTTNDKITTITGGTLAGSNLFHSFEKFSLTREAIADFKNGTGVQNIITRVTGQSISDINGTLKAEGTANLFLINPNGIVFGPNAVLDIGGSFLATTASSINFADGQKFSATEPQTTPTLSINIPIGLQFGSTAALIRNQSQASPGNAINIFKKPVGLQVQAGKTLALVGGDIRLEGGSLTAKSGRIELGSVASNSLVSLNPNSQGWVLGYEKVQNFRNIQLIEGTAEMPSTVDASGEGSGSIQVRGKTVELTGDLVTLISRTTGSVDGRDLIINAEKLIVRDGAQVDSSTAGKGRGGNLFVNASDSVQLIGSFTLPNTNFDQVSFLISATSGEGKAGDININTRRLLLQNGAQISTLSSGFTIPPQNTEFQPATGDAGNLTINASESVELIGTSPNGFGSTLSSSTFGSGKAGELTLTTGKLIIRDGAAINVTSRVPRLGVYLGNPSNLGPAGAINVKANSILLDNRGQLSTNSQTGGGGNITLQVWDVLLLRRNSQISTNAGTANAPGDGGNITINAPSGFIVATPQGNNDITANAFSGAGGRIIINANNIFGFVPRTRADLVQLLGTEDSRQLNPNRLPTSDITAFSQQNPSLNGTIQINTPDVDPSRGLLELPAEPFDASRQIATYCKPGGKFKRGSLIATGKGGIAPSPTDPLMDDSVLVNWITLDGESENSVSYTPHHISKRELDSVTLETQIVPAQGWVQDGKGNVTLVAQAPTVTPHSPLLNSVACAANL